MSTFFPDSQNFCINGGQFSHVGGDQHNHYGHASTSMDGHVVLTQGSSSTMMTVHEHTVFDDFRNLKRGDFARVRDIGVNQYPRICQCTEFMDLVREGWKCEACCCRKADMVFCLAEVDGSPGRVYTTVSYNGPEARMAFKTDLQMYSGLLTSQVAQVYAIDIGTVPSLLLRNELVPYAHFAQNVDFLVSMGL
ncbi:hypothetical protein PM082_013980 [Marasmius tenuissimus]|nr:hypothetical protein PM082_013980 [Marasmius tenuissimus]